MSKYVKTSVSELEFDGDKVTATIKALELGDLLNVQGINTDVDLMKWAVEAFPRYIEIRGLRSADGSELTITDVCQSAYFLPLMMDLADKLINTAKLQRP